jgi:hypothetical protein
MWSKGEIEEKKGNIEVASWFSVVDFKKFIGELSEARCMRQILVNLRGPKNGVF